MSTSSPAGAAFEKPSLTPELCQTIVVRNAPKPKNFKKPQQALAELGVIDAEQAKFHKRNIRDDLKRIQYKYKIDANSIKSGATVSVSDCSASVQNNAT